MQLVFTQMVPKATDPKKAKFRYSFVKDGIASPWYYKDAKQSEAIARKHFGCSFPLWKHLKDAGKVLLNMEVPKDGIWTRMLNLKKIM